MDAFERLKDYRINDEIEREDHNDGPLIDLSSEDIEEDTQDNEITYIELTGIGFNSDGDSD